MHEVGGRGGDGGGAGWQGAEQQIGCSDLMQECNRVKFFVFLYKKDQDKKSALKNQEVNQCRWKATGARNTVIFCRDRVKRTKFKECKEEGGGWV